MHPTDLEDPDDDEPPADILDRTDPDVEDEADQTVTSYGRRPEIEVEFRAWEDLSGDARQGMLRGV